VDYGTTRQEVHTAPVLLRAMKGCSRITVLDGVFHSLVLDQVQSVIYVKRKIGTKEATDQIMNDSPLFKALS
jgi:hypothetical protein